jgi:hypothetical protein
VILLLGDRPEWQKGADAGIGEDGVESTFLYLDLSIEAI